MHLAVFWILAGLLVLGRLGLKDIITALQMESILTGSKDSEEFHVTFVITMIFMILLWPLVLMDYYSTKNS